jgi:hypothetical protein
MASSTGGDLALFDIKAQNAVYNALFDDLVVNGLDFIPNSDVAELLKRCRGLSTADARALKFKAQRFFKNEVNAATNRGLGMDTFPVLMKLVACAQNLDERWGASISAIDMKAIDSMNLPLVQIDDIDVAGLMAEVTGGKPPASKQTAVHASNKPTTNDGDAKQPAKEALDFAKMDRNPFQNVRDSELEVFRSLFRVLAHVVMIPAPVADKFRLPQALAIVGARSAAALLQTTGVHALSLRSIFTSTMAVFGCTGAWIQWPVFVTLLRMTSRAQQLAKQAPPSSSVLWPSSSSLWPSRRQFTPVDVIESMPLRLPPPRLQCEVDLLCPVEESPELDVSAAMVSLQAAANTRTGGGGGGGGVFGGGGSNGGRGSSGDDYDNDDDGSSTSNSDDEGSGVQASPDEAVDTWSLCVLCVAVLCFPQRA